MTKYLYCIAGPSGSGKTTLSLELKHRRFVEAISYTSRACRGKHDEDSYHFVSEEEFLRMRDSGLLADYVHYAGNWYGVSFETLDASDYILIELEGIKTLKQNYKTRPIQVIGLMASKDVLVERLKHRGDDAIKRIENDCVCFVDLPRIADKIIDANRQPGDVYLHVINFINGMELYGYDAYGGTI